MCTLGLGAALSAATATGLLRATLGPLRSAEDYARQLGLDERATRRVLSVLAAFGIIQHINGHYGLCVNDNPDSLVLPKVVDTLSGHFSHTGEFLRTGVPIPWMDESIAQREASYSETVVAMGRGFAATAAQLAEQIKLKPRQILDVGCGSGVWSLEIASRHPDSEVTGLDFPAVLPAFASYAHQMGLGERIALLPGNMFNVEIPVGKFDLIMVANVLRLLAPESARELLLLLAAAMKPNGQLLLIDAFAGGTVEKDLTREVYSLHLAIRTRIGETHTPDKAKSWMTDAGVGKITSIDCGLHPGAIGAILGQKI